MVTRGPGGRSRRRRVGPRSPSPAWLENLGYAPPEEERIEIGLGYITRIYRRRPTDLGGKPRW